MIIPRESPSRAILERIAADYRRRGYEVVVEPRGNDLPPFLSDATPDIIAHHANENLVIEVKGTPNDVDRAQLSTIAQRIAKEPGWQFVLMATSPDREASSSELTTLDETTIERRLDEAASLLGSGHLEAALMVAWAATEGIIRLLVAKHNLPIDRDDAATLIRSLASEGYIGEDAFRLLNEASWLRSAIAHGRRPIHNESAAEATRATQRLAQLSKALLKELPASA